MNQNWLTRDLSISISRPQRKAPRDSYCITLFSYGIGQSDSSDEEWPKNKPEYLSSSGSIVWPWHFHKSSGLLWSTSHHYALLCFASAAPCLLLRLCNGEGTLFTVGQVIEANTKLTLVHLTEIIQPILFLVSAYTNHGLWEGMQRLAVQGSNSPLISDAWCLVTWRNNTHSGKELY